jgi:Tol biopolymer transport system component/tRNA A-37 threonylcarbamoyl transferase component Bud32
MPIEPGQTLAHYRLIEKIGEGGMGVVWKALDTTLDREVAVKILPDVFSDTPERLARFEREAKLLAALNHPNIATVHGLHEADGVRFLAMEYVAGQDLAERLQRGALPREEGLTIALRVAEALEAAHERGIVHRDLKPANIKLDPDGKVKVLDFGLAKALSDDPEPGVGSLDFSTSPTLTAAAGTQAGVILGTAGYMSPEQARGKQVDRRADVWAFGVILFEMLTGERLFPGETVTDVIAAVVTRDPDWDRLPADTPPTLRRVLMRCLRKDPRRRLRDVGDAALELQEDPDEDPAAVASATAAAGSLARSRAWLFGAAGLLTGALLTWAALSLGGDSGGTADTQLWINLEPPAGTQFDRFLELSPDGTKVVFVARPEPDGEPMLWIRDLDDEQPRVLPGTEGADQPFWSPDSKSIGYFARRRVRRISVDGGVSQALAPAGNSPRGASWGADGTVLYVPDWSEPVHRVSETGGETDVVTTMDEKRLELSHRWPHLLPDGEHFLYFAVSTYPEVNPDNPAETDQSGLFVASLDGGVEPRLLQTARSRVAYRDGRLYYVDDRILMSRPFDLDSLSFTGDPMTIASDVTQTAGALWGGSLFSVADSGRLIFVRGVPENRPIRQLTWVDRQGRPVGTLGEPQSYISLRISPDGRRVAASMGDPEDVWIHDLERGTATRFTFDVGSDSNPIWSPDGASVLFVSTRVVPDEEFMPVRLYRKPASGLEAEESIVGVDFFGPTLYTNDWSPDGRHVAATAGRQGTGVDLLIFSFETNEFTTFLQTEDSEQSAKFSPSGRWLAYESDVSGRMEIYVRAFPGPGGEWQVSTDGGSNPVWSADGKELSYVAADGRLMAVPVESGDVFRHDTPVALFDFPGVIPLDGSNFYDVLPDGSRFLLMGPLEDDLAREPVITLLQRPR